MSRRKFQKGDLVIVNEKISNHDSVKYEVKPGDELKIASYNYEGFYTVDSGVRRFTLPSHVMDKSAGKTPIEKFQLLIEHANDKIVKINAFIKETQAKIDYIKEIESDEFDEDEFKAYSTLTIIEQGDMSKIEKAKAIAALISKK